MGLHGMTQTSNKKITKMTSPLPWFLHYHFHTSNLPGKEVKYGNAAATANSVSPGRSKICFFAMLTNKNMCPSTIDDTLPLYNIANFHSNWNIIEQNKNSITYVLTFSSFFVVAKQVQTTYNDCWEVFQ